MRVAHHLYTFLPEGRTRRGGAQTFHASPSLSPDDQARLEQHCLYERPDWLSAETPTDRYPVSWGYFLLDASRGVLARTGYRGKHGIRAGNFLTHHVVFPLDAFAALNPLRYLAMPGLFWGDYHEEAPLPADAVLAAPGQLPFDVFEVLQRELGPRAEDLFGAVLVSILGGPQAPRVIAALPASFFAPNGPGLALVLGLAALLPRALRPALTFNTYRVDPNEPRLRLSLIPTSSTHLRAARGDMGFLVFDPEGGPMTLPAPVREYARLAWNLSQARETQRLATVQGLFAELVACCGGPPPVGALEMGFSASEVSQEAEISALVDGLPGLSPEAAGVVGDVLWSRVGPLYVDALSQGKLSGLGIRLLARVAARGALSAEEQTALSGVAKAAAENPQRAPWSDLLSLVSALDAAGRRVVFAEFSVQAEPLAAALPDEALLALLSEEAPRAWSVAALGQLAARGVLSRSWSSLAGLARSVLGSEPAALFLLLRSAGLFSEAAEVFLKRLLPSVSPLAPWLAEGVEVLRRARYEDGELGRALLENCPRNARAEIVVFAAQHNLLGAFRRSLAEIDRASLRAADERLQAEGASPLSAELERLGLYRQALRLFAERQASRSPLEAMLAALRRAGEPKALDLSVEVALEYAAPEDAEALLVALASRVSEARLAASVPALAQRLYAAFPGADALAIVPAAFLDRRAARATGARLLREGLDRRAKEQRRAYLADCLRRLTLSETSERELAEALLSAFEGSPDPRVSWLIEEAESAGLPLVARLAKQAQRGPVGR